MYETFDELGIQPEILQAVKDMGFEEPTPIQKVSIPVALSGKDLIGQAQTGTGKTAAFGIPVLERIDTTKPGPQAVILSPTRELAIQSAEEINHLAQYLPIHALPIYGGQDIERQFKALRKKPNIIVATPGRLMDHMKRGTIDLSNVQILVLDEGDEMVDMGFIDDIRTILAAIPEERQTMFFSATMPPEIERLAGTILSEPQKVEVTPASSTVDAIDQSVYFVEKAEKINLLKSLLENPELESVLIFTRTKHGADKVARVLSKAEIGAEAIHGNKSQTARQRALTNFKDHTTRVLIATDIAARGIDVDHLTHVINYELPNVPETYVHRIGRTGRAGREGVAFSFCDAEEVPLLKDIQKLIGKEVPIAGGHMYETKEVKAAVAEKKEAIKQESKRRNMFGSKRDGSYWRNKKRAANSSK